MTAPLTPPDCDLQDFPFMPLQVARLRDSDLAAEVDPEACWYAVLLWAASWHQIPAASLPDNDTVLMKLCGLGRDVRTFKRHRDGMLRGFVQCDDGRLYHPVVAEQALAAWEGKIEQRWRTECARIKKHNQRHGCAVEAPSLDEFKAGGCQPVPLDKRDLSSGTKPPRPEGQNAASPGTDPQCPQGNGVQEKGTGTGTNLLGLADANPVDREPVDEAVAAWNEAARAVGWPQVSRLNDQRRRSLKTRLREEGIDGWRAAITKAVASPLLSQAPTWFTFDWIIGPKNFTKLMDGNYDRAHSGFAGNGNGGGSAWGAARDRNRVQPVGPDGPAVEQRPRIG